MCSDTFCVPRIRRLFKNKTRAAHGGDADAGPRIAGNRHRMSTEEVGTLFAYIFTDPFAAG